MENTFQDNMKSKDDIEIKELELIRKNSPLPKISLMKTLDCKYKNEEENQEQEPIININEIDSKMINTSEVKNYKRVYSSDNFRDPKNNYYSQTYKIDKNDLNLFKRESKESQEVSILEKQISLESISDENEYSLVEKILRFVETRKPLNHVLCGYFSKIFNSLSKLKISQVLIINNLIFYIIDIQHYFNKSF
jgi:hypothetical protein